MRPEDVSSWGGNYAYCMWKPRLTEGSRFWRSPVTVTAPVLETCSKATVPKAFDSGPESTTTAYKAMQLYQSPRYGFSSRRDTLRIVGGVAGLNNPHRTSIIAAVTRPTNITVLFPLLLTGAARYVSMMGEQGEQVAEGRSSANGDHPHHHQVRSIGPTFNLRPLPGLPRSAAGPRGCLDHSSNTHLQCKSFLSRALVCTVQPDLEQWASAKEIMPINVSTLIYFGGVPLNADLLRFLRLISAPLGLGTLCQRLGLSLQYESVAVSKCYRPARQRGFCEEPIRLSIHCCRLLESTSRVI